MNLRKIIREEISLYKKRNLKEDPDRVVDANEEFITNYSKDDAITFILFDKDCAIYSRTNDNFHFDLSNLIKATEKTEREGKTVRSMYDSGRVFINPDTYPKFVKKFKNTNAGKVLSNLTEDELHEFKLCRVSIYGRIWTAKKKNPSTSEDILIISFWNSIDKLQKNFPDWLIWVDNFISNDIKESISNYYFNFSEGAYSKGVIRYEELLNFISKNNNQEAQAHRARIASIRAGLQRTPFRNSRTWAVNT
jgi:hypothetical protein